MMQPARENTEVDAVTSRRRKSFAANVRRGRRFETEERAGWSHVPKAFLRHEAKTSWAGRRGRIDLKIDDNDGSVTIVEIKSTRWDTLRSDRIRSTALRHARQVWRYINDHIDHRQKDVFAGIVYEHKPVDADVRHLVEQLLNDRFIQVAWRKELS
jgi:hypothetical protein